MLKTKEEELVSLTGRQMKVSNKFPHSLCSMCHITTKLLHWSAAREDGKKWFLDVGQTAQQNLVVAKRRWDCWNSPASYFKHHACCHDFCGKIMVQVCVEFIPPWWCWVWLWDPSSSYSSWLQWGKALDFRAVLEEWLSHWFCSSYHTDCIWACYGISAKGCGHKSEVGKRRITLNSLIRES